MEASAGHFLETEKWKGSLLLAARWWHVAQEYEPQGDLNAVCREQVV